ncbi:MAG: bacterioferritin-associated ferredoxin [Providencia heimbachae]|nr:bacterioferritin-associated ferredoxin [Providencia heimbachae]
MYVCLCEAITDKQIRNVAKKYQVTSLKGLRQILPVGRECGKCLKQAREILDEECAILADMCVINAA